ncbi:MAG: lysostaphin resistance A-like protein [Anaerolineae bacterium]
MKGIFVKGGRLRPPWRVLLYLIAILLAILILQVPIYLVYVSYLLARGETLDLTLFYPTNLPPLVSLLIAVTQLVAVLIVTHLFRRFLDGRDLGSLGLQKGWGWPDQWGFGLLLGFTLAVAIFLLELVGGWLTLTGFSVFSRKPGLTLLILLNQAAFFLFSGASEEVVFRGYMLQNLQESWGSGVAVIISSLIFGLVHSLNPNTSFLALTNITLTGVLFSYAYLVRRSLWLPIALHFSWNFSLGPLFSFPVSGLPSKGLLAVEVGQTDAFITGGAFGPEGGLIGLVAVLAGIFLVWAWTRRMGWITVAS